MIALLQQQLAAQSEALEAEKTAHALTRAREQQATGQLLAAQQQMASDSIALAATQRDLSSARDQNALLRQQQRAADKAAHRQTSSNAALSQQLTSSSTCLQQQRKAAVAAQKQASVCVFARVRLEAQLRISQQLQRTLEQQLEQARSEREQAAAVGRALSTRLQQANAACFTAQQALAAERAQRSMTVAQRAAQQEADCFVQVTRVASHGRGSSKPSSSQAATSSEGRAYRVGMKVCAMVGSVLRGVLCSAWV
jgi:hypothetical protein